MDDQHFSLDRDEFHDNTHNGLAEDFDVAASVHVMHTEGHAAKFGCVGDAADTQHL